VASLDNTVYDLYYDLPFPGTKVEPLKPALTSSSQSILQVLRFTTGGVTYHVSYRRRDPVGEITTFLFHLFFLHCSRLIQATTLK